MSLFLNRVKFMVISRDEQNMQPFYKCQCKGIRKGNALFHCSDRDPLHELISGVPSRYGYVAARGLTLARRFPVYQIGINSLQLTMPTASLTAGRFVRHPCPSGHSLIVRHQFQPDSHAGTPVLDVHAPDVQPVTGILLPRVDALELLDPHALTASKGPGTSVRSQRRAWRSLTAPTATIEGVLLVSKSTGL